MPLDPQLVGYSVCREKMRHLTCFDTKTCPLQGEFDRLPYARAIVKYTDDQIPNLLLSLLNKEKVGMHAYAQ